MKFFQLAVESKQLRYYIFLHFLIFTYLGLVPVMLYLFINYEHIYVTSFKLNEDEHRSHLFPFPDRLNSLTADGTCIRLNLACIYGNSPRYITFLHYRKPEGLFPKWNCVANFNFRVELLFACFHRLHHFREISDEFSAL